MEEVEIEIEIEIETGRETVTETETEIEEGIMTEGIDIVIIVIEVMTEIVHSMIEIEIVNIVVTNDGIIEIEIEKI